MTKTTDTIYKFSAEDKALDVIDHTPLEDITPERFNTLYTQAGFYGHFLRHDFGTARFTVGGLYVTGDLYRAEFKMSYTDFVPVEGFSNYSTWQLCFAIDNNSEALRGVTTMIINGWTDKGIISTLKTKMNVKYGCWAEQYYKEGMNDMNTGLQSVHWNEVLEHFKDHANEVMEYHKNK